jgi:hypothetical protein
VHSASNRSEYQGYILGGGDKESGQPYPLNLPVVYKSWDLNLLESKRPVQLCNGIIVALEPTGQTALLLEKLIVAYSFFFAFNGI